MGRDGFAITSFWPPRSTFQQFRKIRRDPGSAFGRRAQLEFAVEAFKKIPPMAVTQAETD
jgi:hypothetical protein